MKNKSFKKLPNGYRFQIGGIDGENFRLYAKITNTNIFLIIDLNTELLINIFGFNCKTLSITRKGKE